MGVAATVRVLVSITEAVPSTWFGTTAHDVTGGWAWLSAAARAVSISTESAMRTNRPALPCGRRADGKLFMATELRGLMAEDNTDPLQLSAVRNRT